ncbi:hypothetical protein A1A1_00933 [Planococcus antarcticus DSM 14505]|uniref:DUF3800 domain-containing protein n=1 Tax=Planococcus antarcticus DSM 14505 TaxID=1185653 RepID=A0AA87IQG8_9BACL|nr:DUF3800 domain-containing protein [Planococcus antarcticus]EIM08437.1 hypothetical protein A1A1_00933 [Planococcus antarcticus DSM 14505]
MSKNTVDVVVVEEYQEEKNEEELEKEKMRMEEKKSKADELWTAVQVGDNKTLTTRVANILNRYPDTRDSDLTLQMRYWRVYDGVESENIDIKTMYGLEKLTSITRARAKIQNEYKLFQARDKVRQRRKTLEEQEKESQLLDKPSLGSIEVFSDETGKTDTYVFIAGIWFLNEQTTSKIQRDFFEWSRVKEKAGAKLPKEFHFKNLTSSNETELNLYKEFFDLIIRNGEMVSFKAVGANKTKLKRIGTSDLVMRLYYQFVRLGVQHEIKSERILLPKKINLTKDQDGESELVIESIKQEVGDNFKLHYDDRLIMDQLIAMEAHKSIFLQFADLFVASINRKYNNSGNNNKDKLADYILQSVHINEIKLAANKVEEKNIAAEDISDHSVLFLFD